MTLTDSTGQILGLAEEQEKVYDLDLERKRDRVTTFDELRRRMEEAGAEAASQTSAGREPADDPADAPASEPEHEIDVDPTESGQRKTIKATEVADADVTVPAGFTLEREASSAVTSAVCVYALQPCLTGIAGI